MDDVDADRWVQGRVGLLLEELEVVGLTLDPGTAADLIRAPGSGFGCSEEETQPHLDDAAVEALAHTVGTVLAADQPIPDPGTAVVIDMRELGRLIDDLVQVATLGLAIEHHLARQALSLLSQLGDHLRSGVSTADLRIPGELIHRCGLVVHAAAQRLEGDRHQDEMEDHPGAYLRLVQDDVK